jgi:glycosyltransferase involved in cell wall biosynthesis
LQGAILNRTFVYTFQDENGKNPPFLKGVDKRSLAGDFTKMKLKLKSGRFLCYNNNMETILNKSKRIGIDARFYGPLGKGLGRYTKEIVDGVVASDRENEYVVFLSKENFDEFRTDNPRVKKVLARVRWYTFAEQISMPWIIHKEKIDLMHFPHFNVPLLCPVKFIVTIHDLILTKHPTQRASTLSPFLYKIKNLAYRLAIRTAVMRAQVIIAISNYTRDDIIKQFGVKQAKIKMTYEGVASKLEVSAEKNSGDVSGEEARVLEEYRIKRPYLLYVGNAYPHKNLEGLIEVFEKIADKHSELSLVLVGKEDYFYKRVKDFAQAKKSVADKILFPGYIPDEELRSVYKNALAYVFPSFFEGFGLPPLEAMVQGCPVASSNKTCLPEILGEAALYFNPDNQEEMRQIILKITQDASLRQSLIAKGREQTKKYSWQTCVRETLEIYNEVK